MLYGVANSGHRILAIKGANAVCPYCRGSLIPKCGQIKIHHWAHKESKGCPYATGMTHWHYGWLKKFDSIREFGWEIEYFFDSIRFDAFNSKKKQAVEFQRTVDLENIKTKIAFCTDKGIKLYWLINPRLFENFVYTRDFLGNTRHVLFSMRACKRKVGILLNMFKDHPSIVFSIDFTEKSFLPRYVSERVESYLWFTTREIVYDQMKEPYMPMGVYVIKEIPFINNRRWGKRTTLFLDYRKSHFM